jgi:CubicO group peptidase (beta-lactamase class C family)
MESWLAAALDYVARWLDFQLRYTEQPGCVFAAAFGGEIVLEQAFGVADLGTGAPLTPRHRFRVASHSKSFTATGILKLREQGHLKLDDRAGRFVAGLHPEIADATIAQLLSHSAGLVRDGADASQFSDLRPYLDERELRAELAQPPAIPPNTRFKYSNHGFGLVGLIIEAIAGEPYKNWIRREIIEPAGLTETDPDTPVAAGGVPLARGHSGKLPLGHRVVIPGDNPANALAAAGGFVSTAADLARFFGQLDPAAPRSILSVASRREMTRRHWRDAGAAAERHYGLGIMHGRAGDAEWFGHGGAFQGFISQTVVVPQYGVTLAILTNTIERLANSWADGAVHILARFARHGAPSEEVRGWTGRWWNLWYALDLVPMGDRVIVAVPAQPDPFAEASELEISGADAGRIVLAPGQRSHGEPVRRNRNASGEIAEIWLGGTRLVPEATLAAEMAERYGDRAAAQRGSVGR